MLLLLELSFNGGPERPPTPNMTGYCYCSLPDIGRIDTEMSSFGRECTANGKNFQGSKNKKILKMIQDFISDHIE